MNAKQTVYGIAEQEALKLKGVQIFCGAYARVITRKIVAASVAVGIKEATAKRYARNWLNDDNV